MTLSEIRHRISALMRKFARELAIIKLRPPKTSHPTILRV